MSRTLSLIIISLLATASASAQSYTQVGSYNSHDSAPSWSASPTNYNCVQACALLLGGDASEYRCSTVPGVRNNMAWVDAYAVSTSCDTPKADTLYTPGTYAPGSSSAYVRDHGGCNQTNYCWRAVAVTTADAGGPYSGVEGVPLTLTASLEHATSQSWDCEDDGVIDSTSPTASCTYPDQGTYTARLTASGSGSDSDTATVVISNADPVISVFDVPSEVAPNDLVTLSVVASDVDALTYDWDFGDSDTATGATPTHAWSTPGDYTVTVTVDDGDGGVDTASASLSVCVDVDADGICDNVDPCTIGAPYDWTGDGFDDGCRGDNNIIDPTVVVPGGTQTGDDVTIAANAVIGSDNVLQDGVWIAPHAQLGQNNILQEGVLVSRRAQVGDDNHIERDAVIGRDAHIGSNVYLGSFSIVGYGGTVGDNVSVTNRLTLGAFATLGGVGASPDAVVCPGPLVIARSAQVATDTPWTFQCTGQVTVGPGSIVGADADVGSGIRLRKDATLADRIVLGDSVRIERDATLQSDVSVLDAVVVSPGVQLCDTSAPFDQDLPRDFVDPTCP